MFTLFDKALKLMMNLKLIVKYKNLCRYLEKKSLQTALFRAYFKQNFLTAKRQISLHKYRSNTDRSMNRDAKSRRTRLYDRLMQ